MKKKILNIFTLLASLSLVLAACGNQPVGTVATGQATPASNDVIAEGRVEPIHATNLSFQASGLVEQVFVKEGDVVKAGDVLVRLVNAAQAEVQVDVAQNDYNILLRNESGDRANLWLAYMDAQKKRAAAQKKWDGLNVDDIETRIDDAKATVSQRLKDLNDAQDDFNKYKDLDKNNSTRKDYKNKLDNAQENYDNAVANLESITRERDTVRAALDAALGAEAEAKYQYEISLTGPNADQLAYDKANLAAAKAALSNYVLTAPFDGVVLDVNVKAGEQAGPAVRAVSVADTSQWLVETTDVTELEVVKLTVGQKVTMVPDALPDLTLKGTVTEISNAYTQQGGDILYTVHIHIDTPDDRLRWGMTVEATFVPPQSQQ